MDGCLTLKTYQEKDIPQSSGLAAGANAKVHHGDERHPKTVQGYRRFLACEGTARSHKASAVEVPMRPSSAIFSLLMVSMVPERVFVVSAVPKNCQRVFVTKKDQ